MPNPNPALAQLTAVSFDCGGAHVIGQWSDAANGYVLTSFGNGATDMPIPPTYANLTTLFAAAQPIIAPFAGPPPTSGFNLYRVDINRNPYHYLLVYNSATSSWQVVDYSPAGAGTPSGSYTLAQAFAAAAALMPPLQ